MKVLEKSGLALLAALALEGRLGAGVDETVTANLTAGMNANQVAAAVGAAWSQVGAFGCGVTANTLTATNTSGDCTNPVSQYTFTIDGGPLSQNHTFKLRIQCASPLMASVEFDGGGFTTLSTGGNVFTPGLDTIRINFQTGPAGIPTMSEWLLGSLGVGLVAALVLHLRRRQASQLQPA